MENHWILNLDAELTKYMGITHIIEYLKWYTIPQTR